MAEIKNTKAFYNTVIPSDWDIKKLGDLGKVVSGLTYSPDDICEETGVLVLRSSNVQGGQITFDDNVFVKVKERDFNPVENGDILICVRNGSKSLIGKCALINEKSAGLAFGAFMAIYRGKYNNYLIHVFNTDIYNREIHRNLGATINSINGSDLKEFKIPLPPLPEQKAIAQVLSTADAAIHTTEKLIAQKVLRKKWLMQQLLTGKKRLNGFGGEWKEMKLGKLFNQIKNINDGGDTHSVMTISSKLGLISQEDKFDRVIAGDSLRKYTQLIKGDFAYNKGNSKTYPMGCIYRLEEKESALVPFVYICFSPTDLVDGLFYKHWFLAHGLDRQLNTIITSGARGDGLLNVNTDDFFKLKVPYPTKEEQTAIAQVLQAADKEISLLKAKAEKLREQKKGLMQVLLTGKVRLKIDKLKTA